MQKTLALLRPLSRSLWKVSFTGILALVTAAAAAQTTPKPPARPARPPAYPDRPPADPVVVQRGKALYTADGKLGWDADDLIAWFKLWSDLRAAKVCVGPDDQALDATAAIDTTMITLGKAATTFANSNQLVAFQAINKDKITIANFPRIATDAPGGHYRKPSMFFSIGGTSAQKEAAAKFLSFFVNDQDASKVLGVERGIPCSKAVREATMMSLPSNCQSTY